VRQLLKGIPMKRTLSLSREALTELTTDELAGLAAGAAIPPPTPVVHTLPVNYCLGLSRDTCINC
jgi:hypothetical protein